MLRAASSRYTLQRNIRPSIPDSLYLPFLYPSISRNPQWLHTSSLSPVLPTKSSSSAFPRARSHSTASSAVEIPDGVPTVTGEFSRFSAFGQPRAIPGETPSLVIVDTPQLRDEIPRKRKLIGGISEDRHEVLATFQACISVGRLARAQLMLNMITTLLDASSPVLLGAHNAFLKALLKRALAEKNQDSLRVFFGWYEDNMKRELDLTGDATTMALLLQGSLAVDNTAISKRYIQQYVTFWKEHGREVKEIFALDILSVDEVIEISRICGLDSEELDETHRELFLRAEPVVEPPLSKVPEVDSSNVKGSSLWAIRASLKSLTDPRTGPSRQQFGQNEYAFQVERQKQLELNAIESAQERWRKDHEELQAKGLAPLTNSINSLLWSWHQSLVPLIEQELDRVAEAEDAPDRHSASDRCLYGPFLRLMSPDKIAAIVVLEVIRLRNVTVDSEGTKSSQAVMSIGKTLEQEYYAQELSKRKNRDIFGVMANEELEEIFSNRVTFRAKVRSARNKSLEKPQETADLMFEWPGSVRAKLGAVLISMLLHCAKVPVTKSLPNGEKVTQHLSAMNHAYEYVKGRRLGVIKLHPEVIKRLGHEPLRGSTLGRNLPMLVPPRPWVAWNDGGYFYTRSRVVRTKQSREQDIYVQTASDRGDLDDLFQGLDVLGQTPWKINKKVFDVVLEVWNDGGALAEIPPRELDIEIPPEPETKDPKCRHKWVVEVRNLKNAVKNNHSTRCTINLKVEIARAFLFEKFYFPHNMDFRGRAYPIPPNLNHIGDDLSRGLLMFAEGEELGENGLKWLKIHCANLTGYDKASFSDRVKFIDENLEDVFDSADKPLEGRRWWLKAEDPWQTLATCISITEALRSEDPTKYKCHTPVAQDGTCNGLQHYAALGGDPEGARQVNLEPSDKPQDVYTGVAELVKKQIEEDLKVNNEFAKLLHGHITRKVVKQSVMTNVYGVTFIGARTQIQNQLKDNPAIPWEKQGRCASYVARLVFASIKEVFTGATEIQHWLALSARMISRSVSPAQYQHLQDHSNGKLSHSKNPHIRRKGKVEFMTSVVWTTPLKMAIVQPYRQESSVVVQTNLQKVYISDPSAIDQVNSRKQMTAFPPNFIHSLDATHMLLSAVECAKQGLTFAAVHDSFWTHPNNVDNLNRILRDAFIKLHSEDIMQKLKEEFETRYKGYKYLVSIPAKSTHAMLIKLARREYAMNVLGKSNVTVVEDLQWELERDRLLASADPAKRQRGENMITPSVILRNAGGAQATEIEESLGAELGNVDAKEGLAEEEGVNSISNPDDEGAEVSDVVDDEVDSLEDVDAMDDTEAEDDTETKDMKSDSEEIPSTLEVTRTKNPSKPPQPEEHVWMPLEFLPLPPKGEFDVRKLKDSQYFFS